jgi:hypothetical protein
VWFAVIVTVYEPAASITASSPAPGTVPVSHFVVSLKLPLTPDAQVTVAADAGDAAAATATTANAITTTRE